MNYFTGLKQNITLTSNQRLEMKIGEDNLEVLISSKDMFGVFGSNNPKTVASIVSHDWFKAFNGKVEKVNELYKTSYII